MLDAGVPCSRPQAGPKRRGTYMPLRGSAARTGERTPMLAARAVLLFLLAPAAASPAASSAETHKETQGPPSGNAIQQRGSNPAQTIPLALSLSSTVLGSGEAPPDNPAQRRACLDRHRFFPLLCARARSAPAVAASPPPPLPRECDAQGGHGAVCHYGRGQCVYDDKRGWFCACGGSTRPRSLHPRARASDHALAPDCIDIGPIGDIESTLGHPVA